MQNGKSEDGCPRHFRPHNEENARWSVRLGFETMHNVILNINPIIFGIWTNVLISGWTVEVLGLDSRRGLGIFLFTTASRTALGPTEPPIQGIKGALSLGVERPGRETGYSPPPSTEVKECVELHSKLMFKTDSDRNLSFQSLISSDRREFN
jgi:hypothetical protein